MEKKVAIFDIDETIIKKDSMFLFVLYGVKKRPWTFINLVAIGLVTVLYKLKLMKVEKVKGTFFYAIRYFAESDLQNFYNDVLVDNLYQDALKELQEKKEAGFHVLLVSASPYAYVKYFNNLPCVDSVIGTELVQMSGRYTNVINGNNCKGEEKVVRIRQYLADTDIQIDYDQSCAYSDSLTDMPMFQLVKNRYLINKHSPGLEALSWKA